MPRWRGGQEVTPIKNLEFDDVKRIFGTQQQIGCRPFMGECIFLNGQKYMEIIVGDQGGKK